MPLGREADNCPHGVVVRIWGSFRCQYCKRVPPVGWVYRCVETWRASGEGDFHPNFSAGVIHASPPDQPMSTALAIRGTEKLKRRVIHAIGNGFYTAEEIKIMVEQKKHVDRVRAVTMIRNDAATLNMSIATATRSQKANAAEWKRLMIRNDRLICKFQACWRCKRMMKERAWEYVDAATTIVPEEFEFQMELNKHQRVSDVNVCRQLGLPKPPRAFPPRSSSLPGYSAPSLPAGQLPLPQLTSPQLLAEQLSLLSLQHLQLPASQLSLSQPTSPQLPTGQLPLPSLQPLHLPAGQLPLSQLTSPRLPAGQLPLTSFQPSQLPGSQLPTSQLTSRLPAGQLPLPPLQALQLPVSQLPLPSLPTSQLPAQQLLLPALPAFQLPIGQLPLHPPLPAFQFPLPADQTPARPLPAPPLVLRPQPPNIQSGHGTTDTSSEPTLVPKTSRRRLVLTTLYEEDEDESEESEENEESDVLEMAPVRRASAGPTTGSSTGTPTASASEALVTPVRTTPARLLAGSLGDASDENRA